MLGHSPVGLEPIGLLEAVTGSYSYLANMSIQAAMTSPLKYGKKFPVTNGVTLANSATLKSGAKLASTNALALTFAAPLKFGVKRTALNNVSLALVLTNLVVEKQFGSGVLGVTLASTSPNKRGRKMTMDQGVALAETATVKFGVKEGNTNLALASALIGDWKAGWDHVQTFNVSLLLSSAQLANYQYSGELAAAIDVSFLYNLAFLIGDYDGELSLDIEMPVVYRAEFWNPVEPIQVSWSKTDPTSGSWTPGESTSGSWTKEAVYDQG